MALVDGNVQGNLGQSAGGQILLHEIFDDAGDPEADAGKLDQQIHAGDFNIIFGLDAVFGQIVVDVLAGHIVLV